MKAPLSISIGLLLILLLACKKNVEEPNRESSFISTENFPIEIPELTGTIIDTVAAQLMLDSARNLLVDAEFSEALKICHQALDVYQKVFQKPDTLQAIAYNLKSEIHWRDIQLDEASQAAQKALDIVEGIPGEHQLIRAEALYNFGAIEIYKRNDKNALLFLQEALTLKKAIHGENHPGVALIYRSIGNAHRHLGALENAIENTEKALLVYQQSLGSDHLEVGKTCNNLANSWEDKGYFEIALDYHRKAVKVKLAALGPYHPDLAVSYFNMGLLFATNNYYEESLTHLKKSLQIDLKTFRRNHPRIAMNYNGLGWALSNKGDYDQALVYYQKSADINKTTQGAEHPAVAESYNLIANAWYTKGDNDKALEYHLKALKIREKRLNELNPELAQTYNNLGLVYQNKKDYKKAFLYLKRAQNIDSKVFGSEHHFVARSYDNIGRLLSQKGKHQEAITSHLKAIDLESKLFGDRNPIISITHRNTGESFIRKGDYEKAYFHFKRAATVLNYNFDDPTNFSTTKDLDFLSRAFKGIEKYFYHKWHELKESVYLDSLENHYNTMVALEDHFQKEFSGAATRQYYASKAVQVYEGAIKNLLQTVRQSDEKLLKAFVLAEKTKVRQLSEKIQFSSEQSSLGLPDSLHKKEQKLKADLAFYESKKAYEISKEKEKIDGRLLEEFKDKIFNLQSQQNELVNYFKSRYPEYYQLRYNRTVITINEVQQNLLKKDNQVLVEYFVGDSSIYIFTITPKSFHVADVKLDFPLEQWIQSFRCGLFQGYVQEPTCNTNHSNDDLNQYLDHAYKLYQKLFEPIETLFPEQAELIIVPDGVLGYLPFEALIAAPPQSNENFYQYSYLLKHYTIQYAYSAALQWQMESKRHLEKPTRRLLAMAPIFEQSNPSDDSLNLALRSVKETNRRNWLDSLSYNIPEVLNLQEHFDGDFLVGPAATKSAFIDKSADYRILHLATHSKADDKKGENAFLAFYRSSGDSLDNSWLYNRELYNLQLNADMVVLSACETGIGELQRGEGIISLARGFSYAGAKSIITSLWNVDDRSTMILMEGFYKYLKSGMPKNQALRQAKLDFLEKQDNPIYRSPLFWAALIPVGDMTPIEHSGGQMPLFVLMGALLLLSLIWYWWRSR